MAVPSEDIKLKVVIDTEGADLSGIQAVDKELVGMGQVAESAIDRVTAAVSSLNSKASATSAVGDGFKTIVSGAASTESALASLGTQLSEVHAQFRNLRTGTEAFDALKVKSQELQSQISQLKNSSDHIISPAATTNTRALNGAMIDLSRVIQDMPYGMQGIANNLQQLPGSMGRLKEEADATGTSMGKLLTQGLFSPAGVGIAVSAITALWVAWDMYGEKVTKALGLQGVAVANLDQQLDGIQKYKDFDLQIKIHGAEGLAKLKLELQQLIDRKAYLEGTLSRESTVNATSEGLSLISAMTNPLMYGITMAEQEKRNASAKLERSTFESRMAEQIKNGKKTLSQAEDIRLTTTYYKMTTEEAKKLYAVNQANLNIEDKRSEIALKTAKDLEKLNKTSTQTISFPGWNAFATQINEYNAYMTKREEVTVSVAQAEEIAVNARKAYTAASIESATSDADYAKKAEHMVNAKKDVAAADELLKSKSAEYNRVLKEGHELSIKSEKILGTYKDDTLSIEDALLGVNVAQMEYNHYLSLGKDYSNELIEAEKRLKTSHEEETRSRNAQKAALQQYTETLSLYGAAAGLSSSTTSELEKQFKLLQNAGDNTNKTFLKLSSTLSVIGTTLGGTVGSAITKIGQGLTATTNLKDTTGLTGQALVDANKANANQQALGYAAVANGVGQMVGGQAGNVISSTASMAATGFMVGGPIGAGIGAVVGLASSLFGGGGRDTTQLDNTNASSRQSIEQMAVAGSAVAMKIMAAAGYTDARLKELRTTLEGVSAIGLPSALTGGSQTSLFDNDWSGVKGKNLVAYLQSLQAIDTAVKGFSSTSFVTTLSQINYKWDALTASMIESTGGVGLSVSQMAEIAKAKMDDLIVAVTGISANSVGSVISESFSSYSGFADAGTAAASKIKDAIVTSIQNMAISNLVNSFIMPMMESALSAITTKLISGTALTPADYSSMANQINSVTSAITPLVNSLYSTFQATGLLTTAQQTVTGTTTDLTAVTNNLQTAQKFVETAQTNLDAALKTQSEYLNQLAVKAMQENVTALQAQASTAATAMNNAKTAVTDSLNALKSSIDTQKQSLTDLYDAQVAAINAQVTSQNSLISALSSISSTLHSALLGFSVNGSTLVSRQTAQADLSSMLTGARSGIAVDETKLSAVLSALNQPSQSYFATQTEYARDFYRTVGQVQALSSVTDNQMTTAQKQLSTIEQQLQVLKDTYSIDTRTLDATYNVAVQQVNATYGVNSAVLSVSSAVGGVQTALGAYASATLTAAQAQAAAQAAADALTAKTAADNLATTNAQIAANAAAVAAAQSQLSAAIKAAADAAAAAKSLADQANTGVAGQGSTAGKAYQTFLARAGSASDISYWNGAIGANGVAAAMIDFTNAPEFMDKISSASDPLDALFQAIFGRAVDAAGRSFYGTNMANGETLLQVKNDLMNSAEYASIRAVRGYATGGYHDGGWMMVGEEGRELVNTGSSAARIYNHQQTQSLIDISALVASNDKVSRAIDDLREEMKAGDAAIALNTLRIVKILQMEFQGGGTAV